MSFIEFICSHNVYFTNDFHHLRVCNFNPLNPLDLIPLCIDERASFDGNRKTQMVKAFYESVRQHIKKKNDQYISKNCFLTR